MGSSTRQGGCQCGKVRYRTKIDPGEAYLCHCRMCQRATGGVSIAYVHLPKADLAWDSEPDWFASSPIARRPFCSACGTPLGFAFNESENMDITLGSLDDPGGLAPQWHFGAESMHEAWLDTSQLPRKKTTDYEPLVEQWIKATGKVPD